MTLQHIIIFTVLSLGLTFVVRTQFRLYGVMLVSLLSLFWLQPAVTLRNYDFWLPLFSIGLTALVWSLSLPRGRSPGKQDLATALLAVGAVMSVGLTRYLPQGFFLTASRPPTLTTIGLALSLILLLAWILGHLRRGKALTVGMGVVFLIALLSLLKTDSLNQGLSRILRIQTGQNPALASTADLRWLGISYIALRLIHTLRDRQAGRLPEMDLRDYLSFVLFFPAVTAGPIDRAERFLSDLQEPVDARPSRLVKGGTRIVLGIFKKFVLADGLAYFALNAQNAGQFHSPGWMWLSLYAYAFRLYLDFSGYTDVAIGIGILAGVKLPENFDRPYLKPNLTAFWNSWHISLALWFRTYFFNPFTRALRRMRWQIPVGLIVFLGQVGTMALIGLWHGITWNFLLWGLWHGLGLFVHNRWVDWTRQHGLTFSGSKHLQKLVTVGGVLMTFHFVLLGWVWFVLPEPRETVQYLAGLIGLGS